MARSILNPMRRFISFSLIFCSTFLISGFKTPPHQNGDLIFIVNPSGQGKAIQLATRSRFTHIGIIFFEDGKEMVYHAVEPVTKSTLKEFLEYSADGNYEIRRLKDRSLLTDPVIKKMLSEAKSKLGLHYDLFFSWDDSEMYCSEYVWKIYKHALNINVGMPKPLKNFDLSHPIVKAKLEQRYGNNVPLNENMISPGDMFSSHLLE